jgi:hypothetical protein
MDFYKILSIAKKWPNLQLFQGKWGRGGVLEADGNPTVKKLEFWPFFCDRQNFVKVHLRFGLGFGDFE